MRTFKVRFHLAQGVNFMKWQVKDGSGNVEFYDPSKVSIKLTDCFLKNRRTTAEKIHQGENKTVCAWIECADVEIIPKVKISKGYNISYNPREQPNWMMKNEDSFWHGEDIDQKEFDQIVSSGKKLYSV